MMSRDIVQFMPFRDVQMSGELLAKELLASLPEQIVKYTHHRKTHRTLSPSQHEQPDIVMIPIHKDYHNSKELFIIS